MSADTAHDPRSTATYRVMLWVVIILGVLIVLAFGALIVGGIMKFTGRRANAPALGGPSLMTELPPGARITTIQTTGNRLVIEFHDAYGDGVEIVDTDTGKAIATIAPAPHGLPK